MSPDRQIVFFTTSVSQNNTSLPYQPSTATLAAFLFRFPPPPEWMFWMFFFSSWANCTIHIQVCTTYYYYYKKLWNRLTKFYVHCIWSNKKKTQPNVKRYMQQHRSQDTEEVLYMRWWGCDSTTHICASRVLRTESSLAEGHSSRVHTKKKRWKEKNKFQNLSSKHRPSLVYLLIIINKIKQFMDHGPNHWVLRKPSVLLKMDARAPAPFKDV